MDQPNRSQDLQGNNAAVIYRELPVGAKVRRKDGAILEVTGNPGDGAWLLVRVVEAAHDPSSVGQEDMVFFTDVEGVV